MKRVYGWVLITLAASSQAWAGTETVHSTSMSFEDCLAAIRATAADLGVAPVNIVETNDLRMIRFKAADSSILVTCSRVDRKMVITKSDNPG